MIESFMDKVDVVNRWLGYLGRPDTKISIEEEEVLPYLLDYFKCFSIVTKVLEGSKYSTINIATVLLEEVKSQIKTKQTQIEEALITPELKHDLKRVYENTLENLESRFTINDLMVTATLLDPIFQSCDIVGEYLEKNHHTRKSFLKNMYDKYVGKLSENVNTDEILNEKQTFLKNLAKKTL